MEADSYDEMHSFLSGDDSCDRLLSGQLSSLDVPGSLRGVAALFEAAAGPAAPAELARERQMVAALTAEVLSSRPQLHPTPSRRRAVLSKVLTAKFAALATAAAFGIGTAAAAAAGSLPGQTSHANSHATAGLATAAANQTPHGQGNSSHPGAAGNPTNGSIPLTGPANSHAEFGLCTAFLAAANGHTSTSGGSTLSSLPQYNSEAFMALIGEHKGVAGTTTYCQGVVASHPSSSDNTTDTGKPVDVGKPANAGKPADTGKPANAGKPADTGKPSSGGTLPSTAGSSSSHAPVSTPNSGGTGTADTASGGPSTSGTSTADTASNGASSAGSGNAPTHP